jgi:hypothetical protein
MKPAALAAFKDMTGKLEGANLHHMYIDMHRDAAGNLDRLVTTGTGNLSDPMSEALRLPWRRPDGSLATQDEIAADWTAIKNFHEDNPTGGNSAAQQAVTTLRLDQAALDDIFNARLALNEKNLRQLAPQYDSWPAAAQVGINSMAWAMGTGNVATFHNFLAAVNRLSPDFTTAATESHIRNASVARNTDTAQLFNEAASVLSQNLDPNTIFFPGPVLAGAAGAVGVGSGFLAALAGLAGIGMVYYGYTQISKK